MKAKKTAFWIISAITSITVLIALLFNADFLQAAAIYKNPCSLAVFPYNPAATLDTTGEAATAHINYLSDKQCADHVDYANPSQYKPQPPLVEENPIKTGSEKIRAPIAQHQHAYFNDSDYKIPNFTFYYKSAVKKFEITVQQDGINNLYTDNISCVTPVPKDYNSANASDLFDCNGTADDLYGGTTVTAKPGDETIVITWEFGTQKPSWKPVIFGNNGSNFVLYDKVKGNKTVDLTDPYSRRLEFGVNLHTKDNGQIWSTTTSSKVLVSDIVIRQDKYKENNNIGCELPGDITNSKNGWCPVPAKFGYKPDGPYYYWFPIGSASSVWKKPPPIFKFPPKIPVPKLPPQPQPQVCENISVLPVQFDTTNPNPIFFNITKVDPPTFLGPFTWSLNNTQNGKLVIENSTLSAVLYGPTEQDASITVTSSNNNCVFNITSYTPAIPQPQPQPPVPAPPIPTPPQPPVPTPPIPTPPPVFVPPLIIPSGAISKVSFEVKSHGNVIKKFNTAEFQVTFVPTSSATTEVTIKDTFKGKLVGSEQGEITLDKGAFSGEDFKLETKNGGILKCAPLSAGAPTVTCFEGNPFTDSGLKIKNLSGAMVILTYRGKLTKSNINESYCKKLAKLTGFCGEKFKNTAIDSFGNQASAELLTPCPFLLTQGIGDVILEKDLKVGSDISSCAGIPNIEGPVITPPEPEPTEVPKTGPDDIIPILPSHALCNQSNTENPNAPKGYQNPLKSVSSAICEMSLTLADALTKPQIRTDVLENIIRIARYNNNLGNSHNVYITDLNNPPLSLADPNLNPNFEVYKLENANLTVNYGALGIDSGSRTYIVENGDLIINGNIKYKNTVFDPANTKQIPSIAFIVINGNIQIAPTVTELSGVFVTINANKPGTGKILGKGTSDKMLKITGSVYGDIEPLFDSRSYVGNAKKGQATIVINFDGRIFYNMPPGLKEILEITPEQVAR